MDKMVQREPIIDVVCPACGCLCDDLRIDFTDDGKTAATGGCSAARDWWRRSTEVTSRSAAEIFGRSADWQQAIEQGAKLLAEARAPLIFGFGQSSTAGVRAAVALADRLGATFDLMPSAGRSASTLAFQHVGQSTCTLGEVQQRADLVVLWKVDPAQTHPRLLEKCGLKAGTSKRVIHIGSDIGDDLHAIAAVRMLMCGLEPSGVPEKASAQIRELAAAMKGCKYGVLFFGDSLGDCSTGRASVAAMLQLGIELNDVTRFATLKLSTTGSGAATAAQVLCWQTGYPEAVNFARGYPRYLPGEASAERTASRGEADVCLIVGDGAVEKLSQDAKEIVLRLPTILLASSSYQPEWQPAIRLTTGIDGVHHAGTVVRMDEVPLPLRAIVPAQFPSEAETLDALRQAIVAASS